MKCWITFVLLKKSARFEKQMSRVWRSVAYLDLTLNGTTFDILSTELMFTKLIIRDKFVIYEALSTIVFPPSLWHRYNLKWGHKIALFYSWLFCCRCVVFLQGDFFVIEVSALLLRFLFRFCAWLFWIFSGFLANMFSIYLLFMRRSYYKNCIALEMW